MGGPRLLLGQLLRHLAPHGARRVCGRRHPLRHAFGGPLPGPPLHARRADEIKRIFLAGLWGAAAFALVQHHLKNLGPQVLACFGAYVLVLALCRWQYGRWLRAQRAKGRWLRGVVLVGSNDDAAQLATMLRSEPELGYLVTGVIGECTSGAPWDTLPTSPSICSIPHLAAATGASGVLIVPYALSSASTQNAIAIAAAANLHVQVWPGWPGIGNQRLRQTPLSDEPFFYVEPRAQTRWQPVAKRALDLVGAKFILLIYLTDHCGIGPGHQARGSRPSLSSRRTELAWAATPFWSTSCAL